MVNPLVKKLSMPLYSIVAAGDQIVGLVPGIDRRSEKRPSRVFRRTGDQLPALQRPADRSAAQVRALCRSAGYTIEYFPCSVDRPGRQRLQGVADAVSNILRPVSVAGSGGFRHQHADEARRDRLIAKALAARPRRCHSVTAPDGKAFHTPFGPMSQSIALLSPTQYCTT